MVGFVLCLVGFLLCLAALAFFSDCDLVLSFYSIWGKSPKDVLRGKVIWVTGASSGIGENLSYALAKNGAILILSARREGELNRVLKRCRGNMKHVIYTAKRNVKISSPPI